MILTEEHFPRAFPGSMSPVVRSASVALGSWKWNPGHGVAAVVSGDEVQMPYRIHAPDAGFKTSLPTEPSPDFGQLPDLERAVCNALLTRHDNGYIRQRHLARVIHVKHEWVVPYVVQLLGEYVIEIHQLIQRELLPTLAASTSMQEAYGAFVSANQPFMALTDARVASYWNVYYRHEYPVAQGSRRGVGEPPREVHGVPRTYPAVEVMDELWRLA